MPGATASTRIWWRWRRYETAGTGCIRIRRLADAGADCVIWQADTGLGKQQVRGFISHPSDANCIREGEEVCVTFLAGGGYL